MKADSASIVLCQHFLVFYPKKSKRLPVGDAHGIFDDIKALCISRVEPRLCPDFLRSSSVLFSKYSIESQRVRIQFFLREPSIRYVARSLEPNATIRGMADVNRPGNRGGWLV